MILDRNAQRAGMQDEGFVVAMPAVEDKGQGLALLRRLAFHVEELRGVGDRLENDDEALGKLQRNDGLLAGGQLERFEHELLHKIGRESCRERGCQYV